MRRPRRRYSNQAACYTVDWSDSFAELFRLAPADWARPERLQVRRTTTGLTIVGLFAPEGLPSAKITVRFRITGPAGPEVVSESLQQRFLLAAGAAL